MPETTKTWQQAQALLKDKLGSTVFDTWIAPLKAKSLGQGAVTLEAPDAFFKEWVEKHYRQAIEEALSSGGAKKKISLALEIGPAQKTVSDKSCATATSAVKSHEAFGCLNLNPRYTFENFVVGPSNRHAHAYCLATADSPAKAYNPLFIYGSTGLGKTHLIQSVCHHIKNKAGGNLKICYQPSEKFTNELIDAIQHHSTAAFRQKYRNVDVLVLDDIHFIAGKNSSQEEFFHTFNTLYDAHKQIILSSDRPPKEIADLQERLVSRFGWGLAVDIQPPDLETRVAILKKKIEREPVGVSDDVIFFIAGLIKTNIRDLEGALVRVMAYSLMEEKTITLDLAKEALKDLLKETKKLITVDFIQRCVAEAFGISLHDLKTRRRNKNIVLPRQIAMYLSREMTDLSLPEIGNYFGGKDHTTVLHSFNKIKGDLVKNPGLKERLEGIKQIIKQ